VINATGNNLRGVTVDFPIGVMTCVTGVSGSGKSTLVNDTLLQHVARQLNDSSVDAAPCDDIQGLEHIDRIVDIDQSPIGRTPRSNPATYTGVFTPIREIYAQTSEARSRGYEMGRFSFNVKGGRCEACEGDGVIKVEMHFLPDMYVPCDVCKGKRYNRETLDIHYKGKNISEVLDMTVEDALVFFQAVPSIAGKLQTLMDVGLTYVRLGQNATTLSGGEAQRVKLAKELSKRSTGRTLYILDEPTTGLHFADIEQLLKVLHRLRDEGNTVVVIEHNLDVIKTADWIIDLGPEGGSGGGQIIATGTPEQIAGSAGSHTGHYLAPVLRGSPSGAAEIAPAQSELLRCFAGGRAQLCGIEILFDFTVLQALTILPSGTLPDHRTPESYRIPVGLVFGDFPTPRKALENELHGFTANAQPALICRDKKLRHAEVDLTALQRRRFTHYGKPHRTVILHDDQGIGTIVTKPARQHVRLTITELPAHREDTRVQRYRHEGIEILGEHAFNPAPSLGRMTRISQTDWHSRDSW
jgi:ABC-type multidrug transport system ATPase subunit